MKTLQKLFVVFISVLLMSYGGFAQRNSSLSPVNKPNLGLAPARAITKATSSKVVSFRGNTAYANTVVDTATHSFVNFDTDQPEFLNVINVTPGWLSFAADFDNVNTNFYYIINWRTGALQTVDVVTGTVLTTIGWPSFAGDFVTGMACDKTTGIMYVCAVEPNAMAYSSIWTVNLVTAVATLVGQTTPDEAIIDIAIDGAGDMYGFGILNDEGLLINKTTAEATVLGPLGFNANNGQGMAYDPQEDVIYIAAFNDAGAGGELRTFDPVSGASALIGVFPDGVQVDAFAFPGVPQSYDVDLGVVTTVSPSTGVNLTATEPVIVRFRNYGTTNQSNIEISYTFDGGTTFTETIPSLMAGEILNYTFATTVDLSVHGTHTIEACIMLSGDQNPANNCKTKTIENLVPAICFPDFNDGCVYGDGFNNFSVGEIQNLNSGCANNTGFIGCSQYLQLGPALLTPGNTYTFTMGSGYVDQHVNIWIDYNDNLLFDADEMILTDFDIAFANILFNVPVTIPADATPGLHFMRAMAVWNEAYTESCQHYTFGECEDYMVKVSDVTSVGNEKIEEGLLIAPNPASDQITINSRQLINAYSMMDISGKIIESKVVGSANFTIKVSQYSEGVYFLRFETDDKSILRKIIIK